MGARNKEINTSSGLSLNWGAKSGKAELLLHASCQSETLFREAQTLLGEDGQKIIQVPAVNVWWGILGLKHQ